MHVLGSVARGHVSHARQIGGSYLVPHSCTWGPFRSQLDLSSGDRKYLSMRLHGQRQARLAQRGRHFRTYCVAPGFSGVAFFLRY